MPSQSNQVREIAGTTKAEIAAFFALPRWTLYLGLLVAMVLLGAHFGLYLLLSRYQMGSLMLAIVPGTAAALTAMLARSAAGRGCLRTIGLGRKNGHRLRPCVQLMIWIVASAVGLGLALWLLFG